MAEKNEDIEQKVIINYDTNAPETAKDVDKLEKANIDLEESLLKLEKANKALANSQGKTKDEVKALELIQRKATLAHKKNKEAVDEATKSTKKQKQSLEDLGGGIGGAIKGFKGLLKQMWALVANPVGLVLVAIVGALALLYKAFTSTKAGAEKFEQVMDGIGATIDVLRDRVLKIGSAIVKFFSGDFKGAIAEGRAAVSGFGAEVAEEFRIAANARKSLQEVTDAMRNLSITRAELDRDLAESERILTSTTASYKDKKKALEEVEAAEQKQTDAELFNARKKLAAIEAQNKQSDSSNEALDAEAEARIAVIELERKSSENRRKVADFNKTLDNEELSRKKELIAANDQIQKQKEEEFKNFEKENEARRAKIKADEEARIKLAEQRKADNDLLQQHLDEEERLEMEAEDLRLENAQKAAEEEKKIEDAKLSQKKSIQDATFSLLGAGLNALKSIFGKNKKIQKGILIAENAVALSKLTMNTIEAVSKDTAASPLTFGMPWAGIHIAQGAIGAANIIASTASGLKELGGGSAGTAPKMGAPRGGGSSAAPSVGFQSSSENQIATTIAANTNELPPQKAYVVSREMSTSQELDRNKVENNSLG